MRALLGSVLLLLAGCTYHVFSPPAGSFAVDTSRTLGEGRTSVKAEGSYSASVWGPRVRSHRLTLRHGLHEKVDLLVAPALTQVVRESSGGSRGEIYALAAGAKYAPIKHFAVVGGFGAGYSAAGAFVSPSLGFILAYENPYVVPFLSSTVFISAPMGTRSVRVPVSRGDDPDLPKVLGDTAGGEDWVALKPARTYGWQSSVGARVWLNSDQRAQVQSSLLLAAGWTTLVDHFGMRESEVYLGGSVALEFAF